MSPAPNIHPDAFVAPNATVLGDVTVEKDASIWYGCVVRGDLEPVTIGQASNIQDLTIIHTDEKLPALIGARVGVGHRSLLHGCVIEDDCLIGMGAILLSGSVIGAGSVVAAGALVTEGTRIPQGSLVMGAPARVVRSVDDELRRRIQHTANEYIAFARAHRAGEYPAARPGRTG
jgi:carbonic anhydrase/acetyltransferase-like protein (isoleucine patch superfamily)